MKNQVINRILEEKIVVIVRGIASDKIIPLAEAMYEGGIRALEITYNASNMDDNAEVAGNIKKLVDHFGDRMIIGAGTVLTTKQVELTKAAGGTFIISPNAKEEIIRKTCELGMVSIPGALTPTECIDAHDAGADFVKLFPISIFTLFHTIV